MINIIIIMIVIIINCQAGSFFYLFLIAEMVLYLFSDHEISYLLSWRSNGSLGPRKSL